MIQDEIMKLQTYKMFVGDSDIYVERDDVLEVLKQEPCGDCISRQKAIRRVKEECNPYGKPTIDFESGKKVIKLLKRIPPVTVMPKPETVTEFADRCQECGAKYGELLKQYKAFAEWVAREVFSDDWNFNKDSFAELACRKLEKLGIVRANGDEWELVELEAEKEDKK